MNIDTIKIYDKYHYLINLNPKALPLWKVLNLEQDSIT
jgi:hypothetical protein